MENSSFGRIFSVLSSPTKTFQSIAERPSSLVAIIVMTLLATGVTVFTMSKVDTEDMVRTQIEQSGREMSDQDMETAVAFGSKMARFAPAAALVMVPLFTVVFSLVFLLGFKVQGSEIGFRESLSVYIYASMPAAVKALLTVPVVAAKAEISGQAAQSGALLMSNLAFLAGEDATKATLAALTSVDVFSVWIIVLLAMGYSIVGKVSKGSATVTVVILWLLGVGLKVGLSTLGG